MAITGMVRGLLYWNGQGTAIYERLGLNYKGSVGSKSYWLPVNVLDLAAFRHDLLYYSPNPITRSYADEVYIEESKGKSTTPDFIKSVSQQTIMVQNLYRTYSEASGASVRQTVAAEALSRKITAWSAILMNPHRTRAQSTALFKEIAKLHMFTNVFDTEMGSSLKNTYKVVMERAYRTFEETPEWKRIRTKNKGVVDAYNKYLKDVGHFDDEDNFIVKPQLSGAEQSKAIKDYKVFFHKFKKYIEWTNTEYKDFPAFKPYALPELNEERLDVVADPVPLEEPPAIKKEDVIKIQEFDKKSSSHIYSSVSSSPSLPETMPRKPEPQQPMRPIPRPDNIVEVEIGVGPARQPPPPPPGKPPKKSKKKRKKTKKGGLKGPNKKPKTPSDGKTEAIPNKKPKTPSDGKTEAIPDGKLLEEKLSRSYEKMINDDDPESYQRLVDFAQKSLSNLKMVSRIVNTSRPFPKGSPFYVTSIKTLKNHLGASAYLYYATKAVPADVKKESKELYDTFISRSDPTGKTWVTRRGLDSFMLKSGKRFMKNLPKKDALKVISAINKREELMGMPPISIAKKSKADLNDIIQGYPMDDLNIYMRLPHLEEASQESKIQAGLRKEGRERHKGSKEGIASELTGKSTEDVVRDTFAADLKKVESKRIMEVSGTDIIYKPVEYFKPGMSADDLKKTFQRMIADTVQQKKLSDALQSIRDLEAFRINTPIGRKDMLAKAIKKINTTPDMVQWAIDHLEDSGVVSALHRTITGDETKDTTAASLMNTLDQITLLSDDKLDELDTFLQEFDTLIVPDIKKDLGDALKETVGKPADVRVLPKGVTIQPIDEKKTATQTHESKVETEMKKQRLLDVRLEKKTADKDEMSALVKEEETLMKDLKAATIKKKGVPKETKTRSHRTGALRPHFKNTTAKAVEQAIGETPEQQAKDFTNWFVFDIPVDQTGVGSSAKNPLVSQNEAREKFLGEGTLFRHFNQTYELTGGIEERKDFFTQHSRLIKAGVNRGLLTKKVLSEEESFLKKFDKDNNGLFPQDQSKRELNHWHDQYQTPNDFFGGVMYPLQSTTNPSILIGDIEKNSNLFPKV
jgi:hypothetical protein